MDLEQLLQTKSFLEEMSLSIRNIMLACFPEMTTEEREDLDNEVKLKMWKNASNGKKVDNLRSYLWRVVYTTALDILGERMPHLSLERTVQVDEAEERLPGEFISEDLASRQRENSQMLEKAVNMLPARRKTVLRLHLTGMDIKQIAASLSWRENQVRHLLYRGLRDLRETMKGWSEPS
jgi:RNA polymerase sigma factor (sigma-70 family)